LVAAKEELRLKSEKIKFDDYVIVEEFKKIDKDSKEKDIKDSVVSIRDITITDDNFQLITTRPKTPTTNTTDNNTANTTDLNTLGNTIGSNFNSSISSTTTKDIRLTESEFFEFKKTYFLKLKNNTCLGKSYFKIYTKPYSKYEDMKFINVSHKGFKKPIQYNNKHTGKKFAQRLRLLNKLNHFLFSENALYIYACEYINNEGVIFGHLHVYRDFIVYESDQNETDYQSNNTYLFSSLVITNFIINLII